MAKDIHKYGTDDGWHGVIEEGGEFPPEKDRYHLYIGMYAIIFHLLLMELVYSTSLHIRQVSSAPSPTAPT